MLQKYLHGKTQEQCIIQEHNLASMPEEPYVGLTALKLEVMNGNIEKAINTQWMDYTNTRLGITSYQMHT
jgi:hypothetical protein